MKVEQIVETLINKYLTMSEDASLDEETKKLYISPLIGLVNIAANLATFTEDRMQSVQNFVGLIQFVSTAYANNLRKGIESNFGIDTEADESAVDLLYTPQVIFYPDFFDLLMSNKDGAKEASDKFIMIARWLSDNSHRLDKADARAFLMKNTGLKIDDVSISSLDSAMTEAVMQSYMVTIYLLKKN